MTPEQRLTFSKHNSICCRGSKTNRQYVIRYGRKVVDDQGIEYCIVPAKANSVPEFDVMLAKKLLIETNEPVFLETAIPDRWTPEHLGFRQRNASWNTFWVCLNMLSFALMIVVVFYMFTRVLL